MKTQGSTYTMILVVQSGNSILAIVSFHNHPTDFLWKKTFFLGKSLNSWWGMAISAGFFNDYGLYYLITLYDFMIQHILVTFSSPVSLAF